MDRQPRWVALLSALLLLTGGAALAGCTGDDKPATRTKQQPSASAFVAAPTGTPDPDARRFTSLELFGLLLPGGSVPAWLQPAGKYLVSNEDVARFFPNPEAALRAMTDAGRVQGAAADYRVPGIPRAGERAVAVASSTSYYQTVAGAQGVIKDPTMELVIHRFGLHTAEVRLATVGDESRAFRGFRDGDGPGLAAYVVLFRKLNVIGAVVVVMADRNDDGGELVSLLAGRQSTYVR